MSSQEESVEIMTSKDGKKSQINILKTLQIVLLLSVLLYLGKSLFIPLSFSLLIACILYPVCKWLENKGINPTISIGISLVLMIVFISAFFALLVWQISGFVIDLPVLELKITEAISSFSDYLLIHFNLSISDQKIWWQNLSSSSGEKILPLLETTIGNISIMIVFIVLIPIMSGLMLYQRRQLFHALHSFAPSISLELLKGMLQETVITYYNFIKGMLIVYLVVGILNSIGLLILGIPHAFLFGFLSAILTFIPYVGIIIGAIFPMIVAWITYDSIWYPAGVVLVFTIVQYLEANIIFPWAVSSKLQINTLSTIIAIFAGGIIWGSAGMILFVPFLGILKMLGDQMPGMESISLLLSTKEKVVSKKN